MLVRKYSRPNHAKSHFAGKIVIPGMKPEIVKWNRPLKVQMCVWASRCAEHNFERRIPLYDFFYLDTKYCREHLSVCVCGCLETGINFFHGDVGIVRFSNEECKKHVHVLTSCLIHLLAPLLCSLQKRVVLQENRATLLEHSCRTTQPLPPLESVCGIRKTHLTIPGCAKTQAGAHRRRHR